ncbi:MAG: SUMF1/EgtB/PvdO family nonheme iron enzyme [Parcubacteria group bacterium]
MTSRALTLPAGYNAIPGGKFTPLAGSSLGSAPITVPPFGIARTPLTNAQWGASAQSLGQDCFVLLNHDWNTEVTELVRHGKTPEVAARGTTVLQGDINFNRGDVMFFGSWILLKIEDNPSAKYDEEGRIFSGAKQPVVGITYFHAKAWCLLKSLEEGGRYLYDLPTDAQYEYVASNGGAKEYGTETGTLFGADGRKLAHIDECNNGRGATVAVDDSRYEQVLPFGVQTMGNVWRWIQMNPTFKRSGDCFIGPYGLRGGSWGRDPDYGRATYRLCGLPDLCNYYIGFSPVVVCRDSPK